MSSEGETRLETKGLAGAAFQELDKFLEAVLGQKAGETLAAEFHAKATVLGMPGKKPRW